MSVRPEKSVTRKRTPVQKFPRIQDDGDVEGIAYRRGYFGSALTSLICSKWRRVCPTASRIHW